MAGDSDVTIMIRDYAGGVPDKIRPNLFTPFITTKEQGLGIGLALSHSIAEAHGGRLRYQPADPGSLFSLTCLQGTGRTMIQRVFIIDDDPAVRDAW